MWIYSAHELQNADTCAVHVISIELVLITTVTTGGSDKNNTFDKSGAYLKHYHYSQSNTKLDWTEKAIDWAKVRERVKGFVFDKVVRCIIRGFSSIMHFPNTILTFENQTGSLTLLCQGNHFDTNSIAIKEMWKIQIQEILKSQTESLTWWQGWPWKTVW